jgi:hypothetical protein
MADKVFVLQYPFEFRGKEYKEFTARRPKVLDVRKFIKGVDKDSVQAMENMLADLMQIDPLVVSQIDFEDFIPMKAWAEDFLKLMLPASQES